MEKEIFEIYAPKTSIPCVVEKLRGMAFLKLETLNMMSNGGKPYFLCKRDKWGLWKYSFENGCFEIVRGRSQV